jgi:hypothetical protein
MDNQQHRFRDCVCCSVIFAVQLKHDRNYKRTVHVHGSTSNPVINVINNVDNSNQISNNSSSNNSNTNNPTIGGTISSGSGNAISGKSTDEDLANKIKNMRVEKAISEGRLSDAEMILRGQPQQINSVIPTATAIPSAPLNDK